MRNVRNHILRKGTSYICKHVDIFPMADVAMDQRYFRLEIPVFLQDVYILLRSAIRASYVRTTSHSRV